jgi:hypothetical protein
MACIDLDSIHDPTSVAILVQVVGALRVFLVVTAAPMLPASVARKDLDESSDGDGSSIEHISKDPGESSAGRNQTSGGAKAEISKSPAGKAKSPAAKKEDPEDDEDALYKALFEDEADLDFADVVGDDEAALGEECQAVAGQTVASRGS